MQPTRTAPIVRVSSGTRRPSDDEFAVEEPLEIRIRGQAWLVTMRTPGHDADLARGLLFTEAVIGDSDAILDIAPCPRTTLLEPENVCNVFLRPDVPLDLARSRWASFAAVSCGLCGKATIESIHHQFPPLAPDATAAPLRASTLTALPAALAAGQTLFRATGGLHAAAVFDLAGALLAVREDIGRHNAVDKVIGALLPSRALPHPERILLVSGRASFEILQKALAARIPWVASLSAASSLAVDFAQASGQTLVAFLRPEAPAGPTFTLCTHPDRLLP